MMTRLATIAIACLTILLVIPTFVCAQRIPTVPVTSVPAPYLRSPRTRQIPNITHLRKPKQAEYTLDAGDTLSIFIDGVLGPLDSSPPVNFPQQGSSLPPSLGFPIVVRENGRIDLPYVDSISVRGLTVEQTRKVIERAYQDGEKPILKSGTNRILVSLMRKRTYRVTVIRQDQNRPNNFRGQNSVTRLSDQSASGNILNLPAGENDVLNALVQTGGLPGVNEKSDIRVQRANGTVTIPSRVGVSYGNNEFPRSNSTRYQTYRPNYGRSTTVPVRRAPGQSYDRRRAELRDGDVVYIDSRQSEVYYTGGLLNGGQFRLPRDTDLDVLEAIAVVGRTAIANQNIAQPTELIVLRRLQGNRQVSIRVDLDQALVDPRQRILVAPGDTLLLRYKRSEKLLNFGNAILGTTRLGRLGR